MRFSPVAALLSLFSLATFVVCDPGPLKDVSSTTMDVSESVVNSTVDEFAVTVQRVDELLEDDGSLLAARIVDVIFTFDMDQDKLTVNGVPVDLGLTDVKVESVIIASGKATDMALEKLEKTFDNGLADVEVNATAQELLLTMEELAGKLPENATDALNSGPTPDFLAVRRVTISTRVKEINGVKVSQLNAVEQIIDVVAGYVVKGHPRSTPLMATTQEMNMRDCLYHHRIAKLWSKLPKGTRVAIAAFFGSLLLLVAFVALPLAAYVHWKERQTRYMRVEAEEPMLVEEGQVGGEGEMDEKTRLKQQLGA